MLSNKVSEIMTANVIRAEAQTPILDVMKLMAEKNVGGLLITENDAPVGIFTEQDVVKRVVHKKLDVKKEPVKKVMTPHIQSVTRETHIIEALGKMYQKRFRHLLVRGENQAIVGVISMRDILRLAAELGRGLAETEVVGSIMSNNLIRVNPSQSIHEAVEMMIKKRVGCVIVMTEATPHGIFTERDLLKRVATKNLDAATTPVSKVMTTSVVAMHDSVLIGQVLAEMQQRGFRHMPIEGEKGDLVGVVSMGDVLKYAKALDVDEVVRQSWKEVAEFWDAEDHYTPG